MNDIVIHAEGLGKKYLIGHQNEREGYTALRDVLERMATSVLKKTGDLVRGQDLIAGDTIEEFWALKDVTFEVRRGEVLGIIGRNGAGKSTLLKILSRITEPSEGRVTIRGRAASLLEVGTGFHPELTGRENIFLNGAILGMRRAEIKRKFDEIVGFAEVERFLDTPVKRYSSGMYIRLAFAVAAHLEPEILIIDEVLAVGDQEFQKKCLDKMNEVASGGRTVLFVSHNLAAISDLCTRAILLSNGHLEQVGRPDEIINACIEQSNKHEIGEWRTYKAADVLIQARLSGQSANNIHQSGSPLKLTLACTASKAVRLDEFCLIFENLRGQRVGILDYRLSGEKIMLRHEPVIYTSRIENMDLVQGTYVIKVWLSGVDIGAEFELGTIEIIDVSRDKLSLFPANMNGILNFRGQVERQTETLDATSS